MPGRESAGFLHNDTPYLKTGHGPPLVIVPGLTPAHDVPRGLQRQLAFASARPLARDFTVYVVNRKRGLQPGESMSDIAGHLASAIEHDLGQPVFLAGTSTGGSVVLQLAVDRPDLVRRLVVIAAAYRTFADRPQTRACQEIPAPLTQQGRVELGRIAALWCPVPAGRFHLVRSGSPNPAAPLPRALAVMASSLALLTTQATALDDPLPCRRENPQLWFSELPADLELAKGYCRPCPMRRVCLAGAVERHEPHGPPSGDADLVPDS